MRRLSRFALLTLGTLLVAPYGAAAGTVVNCGGFAMLGGAVLSCSHTDPDAPAQSCTFSWALLTSANATSVVEGAFLLPPGSSNLIVYQGSGFASALSNPIVLCQGRKGDR